MKSKIMKYLQILKVELEDIEEDLRTMRELNIVRKQNREITDYVCLENMSLLKKEIYGLEILEKAVDQIDPNAFESLDDCVLYLEDFFKSKIAEKDLPEAVYYFVGRKLKKIQGYVEEKPVKTS